MSVFIEVILKSIVSKGRTTNFQSQTRIERKLMFFRNLVRNCTSQLAFTVNQTKNSFWVMWKMIELTYVIIYQYNFISYVTSIFFQFTCDTDWGLRRRQKKVMIFFNITIKRPYTKLSLKCCYFKKLLFGHNFFSIGPNMLQLCTGECFYISSMHTKFQPVQPNRKNFETK